MDYAQSRFVLGTTGCELNGLIFAKIRDERVLQKDFDSAFTKKGVTFALRLDSVFPITTGGSGIILFIRLFSETFQLISTAEQIRHTTFKIRQNRKQEVFQ